MEIGAPSHTHGLSFTRKLRLMSENSPRTSRNEAVVAASGPGKEKVGGNAGEELILKNGMPAKRLYSEHA